MPAALWERTQERQCLELNANISFALSTVLSNKANADI